MSTVRRSAFRTSIVFVSALFVGTVMLASCTASAGAPDPTAASQGGEQTSITFVAGVKGDPFYITMACGAEQAAEDAGASFDFQAPNSFSPTDQIPIVDGVAAATPDVLLIAPTDTESMFAPIARVREAGTKVVQVDTSLDDTAGISASIKTDDYAGGQEAARVLSELVGGAGEVLLLNFQPGVSTTEARGQGFVDEAESLGLTVVGAEYGGTEVEKSAQIVDATLQRHPSLAGVFTTTDYGAQGAITSLRNAAKLGDVALVGFDASPVMVEELRAGNLQAIVSQQASKIGQLAVKQALSAVSGDASGDTIEVPTITIRRDDIDDPSVSEALQTDACG